MPNQLKSANKLGHSSVLLPFDLFVFHRHLCNQSFPGAVRAQLATLPCVYVHATEGLKPFSRNVLSVTEMELTAIIKPANSGLMTTEAKA